MALRIGELMVKNALISMDQLNKAIEEQKKNGGKLGQIVVRLGYLSEGDLVEFNSQQFRIRSVELNADTIQPEVIRLVPPALAKKYLLIPIQRVGATLTVAMSDPSNMMVLDDVKFMTGYNIEPVLATESAVIEEAQRLERSIRKTLRNLQSFPNLGRERRGRRRFKRRDLLRSRWR